VTAGIFMVARMSPLFEHSETALNFVLFIGATTALFMGFLGIIANDIKRVVAYSTLSQLGYMTVALGASAYGIGIFHLMTHAFFKALLFLAAGSVIIGMHHEQDMRKMGGLFAKMKWTAITCWIGALALIGTPFLSGFYSKDLLIEAAAEKAHETHHWIAIYAQWAVTAGVFITAFYTFRMIFMTFHGAPRWGADAPADPHAETQPTTAAHHAHDDHSHAADDHAHDDHGHGAHGGEPHESPAVVTGPLVALAFFSIVIGAATVKHLIFDGGFGNSIFVMPEHDPVTKIPFHGWVNFALHSVMHLPFWLALSGVLAAWWLYIKQPHLPGLIQAKVQPLYKLLEHKYFFDWFNENVLARGSRLLGTLFWRGGDGKIIDQGIIGGSTRGVELLAFFARRMQSGFLYSYAFWMVIGLAVMLGWFLFYH
jgi:NADH-quinone oxidoreductase subunit L